MNSWNISDENSEAPDVEMMEDLINNLQTYTNVNPNQIRVLGSSNGGALANRVFIENTNTGVDMICAIISQLSEAQYRNGSFYYHSGPTGGADPYDGYDVMTTPITGRKYLSICNENDGLIPYTGGPSVGVNFLDAQLATYIVAQSQGYSGTQLPSAGTEISTGLYEYAYLSNQVVHLKGDAAHGTNPAQKDYVTAFFEDCGAVATVYGCMDPAATNYNPDANVDDGSCTYSPDVLLETTTISLTETWSQEPSGWTYPVDISLPTEDVPTGGYPVCILLHGFGSNGPAMISSWEPQLDCHILVSPTGYLNSWNISD